MSAADVTGGNIMDASAVLLNDRAKSVYTYVAQAGYLKIALQELREYFELNNIPVTQQTTDVIQVNAGVTQIIYNAAGTPTNPSLPNNFVEPIRLWERARDVDPFVPMTRRDFLPHNLEDIEINQFIYFAWNNQVIRLMSANQDNDIKMDYLQQLFPDAGTAVDENTQINVVNCQTFLEYRTASLCAEFIERNTTSSQALGAYAVLALDRATGIGVKGKQSIFTRRRPFRAAYKRRGWVT